MDDATELAEFTRLVRAGAIGYLPGTPLALRLRGWVDGAEPGDPVMEEVMTIGAVRREVSGD